ncbi:DUF1648 domain-containing protein [Lentibacillus saliphilus]|uniref:DUF1648 domain-containing protein n=1 Tax=Lentibacillus saliphilus TaxID=2737028 RepID=UPI001C2F932B|nr:DUF5808 domain-containing protein [Lentibacillus saliphilus]
MMGLMFIFLTVLIPVYIMTMFIPYWTRKTESFGVTMPEDAYQQENVRQMRRRYALSTGVLSLLTTIGLLVMVPNYKEDDVVLGIVFACLVSAYMVVSFIIYLYFHAQMKKLKQLQPGWSQKAQLITVNTSFRKQKLTYSSLWYVIGFVIAIAMIVLSLVKYDAIPERFATQYDFAGNPSSWSDKSYSSVLMMPLMQVYMTGLFVLINVIIAKSKQQINAADAERSLQRNIIFRRRWSLFMIWMGNGLVALLSLPQLSLFYDINIKWSMWGIIGFSVLVVVASIVLSITTGQGGSKVKVGDASGGDASGLDRDDDEYWKLGIFYFNRNDPSIFIEKRFGIGWTNNWAHPVSWIFMIAVIGLAVLIPFLLS